MKESDLNRDINRSFNLEYWGCKIPDPANGTGVQRPFDGFSVLPNTPIYYESKLIRNGLYAINFKSIEEHQYANLLKIKKMLPNALCIALIGFYIPRKMYKLMVFDIDYINNRRLSGEKSIKQKELNSFIEQGKFLDFTKIEALTSSGNAKKVSVIQDLKRISEVVISE